MLRRTVVQSATLSRHYAARVVFFTARAPLCRWSASDRVRPSFNLSELRAGFLVLSDSIIGRIDPSSEPAPLVPHLPLLPRAPHHGQAPPAIPWPGHRRKDVCLNFAHLIDHLASFSDQRTDPSSALPTFQQPTSVQVLSR
jgi:hypothetical protein